MPATEVHIVDIDDAFIRNDVVEARRVERFETAWKTSVQDLATARSEVDGTFDQFPFIRADEPTLLYLDIRPGREHAFGRGRVDPFDRERAMGDGLVGHGTSFDGPGGVVSSASKSPRRSRRCAQMSRR